VAQRLFGDTVVRWTDQARRDRPALAHVSSEYMHLAATLKRLAPAGDVTTTEEWFDAAPGAEKAWNRTTTFLSEERAIGLMDDEVAMAVEFWRSSTHPLSDRVRHGAWALERLSGIPELWDLLNSVVAARSVSATETEKACMSAMRIIQSAQASLQSLSRPLAGSMSTFNLEALERAGDAAVASTARVCKDVARYLAARRQQVAEQFLAAVSRLSVNMNRDLADGRRPGEVVDAVNRQLSAAARVPLQRFAADTHDKLTRDFQARMSGVFATLQDAVTAGTGGRVATSQVGAVASAAFGELVSFPTLTDSDGVFQVPGAMQSWFARVVWGVKHDAIDLTAVPQVVVMRQQVEVEASRIADRLLANFEQWCTEAREMHVNSWRGARVRLSDQAGGLIGSRVTEADGRLFQLCHQVATICIMEQTRCSGAAVGALPVERLTAPDAAAHDLTGMEARHWLHEGEVWKLPRIPAATHSEDEASAVLRALLRQEVRMREAVRAHLQAHVTSGADIGAHDSAADVSAQARDLTTGDCLALAADTMEQAFGLVATLPFASPATPPGEAQRSTGRLARLLACALATAVTDKLPERLPGPVDVPATCARALTQAGLEGVGMALVQWRRVEVGGCSLTWSLMRVSMPRCRGGVVEEHTCLCFHSSASLSDVVRAAEPKPLAGRPDLQFHGLAVQLTGGAFADVLSALTTGDHAAGPVLACGHGFGGSCAAVTSLMLQLIDSALVDEVVTFGAPQFWVPVGVEVPVEVLALSRKLKAVIHGDDVFPRLLGQPLSAAFKPALGLVGTPTDAAMQAYQRADIVVAAHRWLGSLHYLPPLPAAEAAGAFHAPTTSAALAAVEVVRPRDELTIRRVLTPVLSPRCLAHNDMVAGYLSAMAQAVHNLPAEVCASSEGDETPAHTILPAPAASADHSKWYTVGRKLGSGGFGDAFAATTTDAAVPRMPANTPVVIKRAYKPADPGVLREVAFMSKASEGCPCVVNAAIEGNVSIPPTHALACAAGAARQCRAAAGPLGGRSPHVAPGAGVRGRRRPAWALGQTAAGCQWTSQTAGRPQPHGGHG